jgi:L-alanine-DL-glutamate epimerase-like enolase superfamily enzyme
MRAHRGGSRCQLAESFGIGETGNELMEALTPRFENGYSYPPEGPGFGLEITESLLRKVAVPA